MQRRRLQPRAEDPPAPACGLQPGRRWPARGGAHRALMHRYIRSAVEIAVTAAALFGVFSSVAQASVEVGPDVRLFGATAEQVDLGRWAVRRFEDAGLTPPVVEIHFHADLSGCGGNLGYALRGRVDLCTSAVDTEARRAVLHEMGHIWLDQNLTPSVRDRFLEMRGLRAWNAGADPWRMRGYEQGAEMIAWALGERILTTPIPDNAPPQLAGGFRLLTGAAPVGHIEIDTGVGASTQKGVVRSALNAGR